MYLIKERIDDYIFVQIWSCTYAVAYKEKTFTPTTKYLIQSGSSLSDQYFSNASLFISVAVALAQYN